MFDWNNDGKNNWHDDYVYHELIPNKENNHKQTPLTSNGCGCLFPVILILLILFTS